MMLCCTFSGDGVDKEGSDVNGEGVYGTDEDGAVTKGAMKDVDTEGHEIVSGMMRGNVSGVGSFFGKAARKKGVNIETFFLNGWSVSQKILPFGVARLLRHVE